MALAVVQPITPDVVEHLLKAGTELFLAFRGGDRRARAEELGEPGADGPVRLEKIDIG